MSGGNYSVAVVSDDQVPAVKDIRNARTDLSVEELRLGCFLVLVLNRKIQKPLQDHKEVNLRVGSEFCQSGRYGKLLASPVP
jgi:hypothetical protein